MAGCKVPYEEVITTSTGDISNVPKLSDRFADESYKILSQIKVGAPTPEQAERIRKKCTIWIIPFICLGYHLMYVDKQTVSRLSSSAQHRVGCQDRLVSAPVLMIFFF